MPTAGKNNSLKVIKVNGDVITFDAGEYGEIEVINNDLILKYTQGQFVDVFLLPENDGSMKGYLGKSIVNSGEFARLKVVANTKYGSFFDMGIEKDLFCPFAEQKTPLEINTYHNVYVYIDELTNRLTASTKIDKFISEEKPDLTEQQSVNILIIGKSQLGYNAIVENKYYGLLYDNEVFQDLKSGQIHKAVIKKIREDNKIDLRLFRNDHNDISEFEDLILNYLKAHKGIMHLNDESEPQDIYDTFGISKKNFKKALGALFRKGVIDLKDKDVKLITQI
ncbi:MAG TPA: GntR family transcriptional regulator [Bacteroidales bacterium]|nr:GntR family transcriptional regulator [Bacteroidales bacterium]